MELKEVTYEVLATGDKMPSGYYLKADVDAEIARLKDKPLDVKDAAHILKAFKFYLYELTHCAYDESTAQWIIDNWEQDYDRVEAYNGHN